MKLDGDLASAILDGIGDAFYAVDASWRIRVFNVGAERHFGVRREDAIGRTLWELVPGSYATPLGARFREVMASGEPALIEDRSIVVQGRHVEGRLFPLDGGLGVSFRDMTERWLAEQALVQRESELARVQRIAAIGGLEVDLRDGFRNRRSPEYLRLHGLPSTATNESHEDWVNRIHPEDRVRVETHFKETVQGDASHYSAEYRIIRPSDGEERWIAASAEIERDREGRPLRLVGAHHDVTDRRRAEERRLLLVNELNHRVKNTLATIQSMARQTLRGPGSPAENLAAFEGRLLALSQAHDVLTREDWAGAEIGEIVAASVRPFQNDGPHRILAVGPHARLRPEPALALAMALQELATNAAKYGALSNEAGRVALRWDEAGSGRIVLSWQESGGPPVAPPGRRGFGSRLIERILAQDLGESVSLAFEPSGVRCVIHLPTT